MELKVNLRKIRSPALSPFYHIMVDKTCNSGITGFVMLDVPLLPLEYFTSDSLKCSVHELERAPGGSRLSLQSRDFNSNDSELCIGYRLRWRSDIWRTDRGVAEVRPPDIRPATDDDIRHNAPGLLETVDQLLRTKVRRKLLNQDKPSRLASYAF